MIKYEIKTGSQFLNEKARGKRDIYKNRLKGMYCRKCSKDTIIKFVEDDLTHVKPEFNSCCHSFDTQIREKLR